MPGIVYILTAIVTATAQQAVPQECPDVCGVELFCLNSINGPDHIIDSKGWICQFIDVNPRTGCCTKKLNNDLRSICNNPQLCDEYFPCCNDYVSCIGCCLHETNPESVGESLNYPFRDSDPEEIIDIESVHFPTFIRCRNHCRNSSHSIFEMNVYLDYPPKYCYEVDLRKYDDPKSLLYHLSGGNNKLDIVIGDVGASCDEACKSNDAICVDDYNLNERVINRCVTANTYFGDACKKRGCLFGYDKSMPIVDVRNGNCFLQGTLSKRSSGFRCDASDGLGQRICLCETMEED